MFFLNFYLLPSWVNWFVGRYESFKLLASCYFRGSRRNVEKEYMRTIEQGEV